jgi:hypothetical protein
MQHSILNISVLIILFQTCAFAQREPAREVTMEPVIVETDPAPKRALGFKQLSLYDESEPELYNIRGFNQLDIFKGEMTTEFWSSPRNKTCISGKIEGGDAPYLKVNWNQSSEACDWVGFGFGWSSWVGKDLLYVVDTLALELTVRAVGEPMSNLPWALGIEDYAGGQALLGYNKKFLVGETISNEWTKVQMPLTAFPFEANDVDLRSVKQLLIQVFGKGSIEIQSIQLVPYARKPKKQAVAAPASTSTVAIDGNLEDWANDEFHPINEDNKFAVRYTSDALFFAFDIKDATPMQNEHQGDQLWKGDAIEIALATNPMADPKRGFLWLSDKHFALNCGTDNAYLWDWTEKQKNSSATYKFQKNATGYTVEVEIPLTDITKYQLDQGDTIDLEIAVNFNEGDKRKEQLRWNSTLEEGFHLSPKKWGELLLK